MNFLQEQQEDCEHRNRESASPKKSAKKPSSSKRKSEEFEQDEEIRLKVNARERSRMHDLNAALDSLREQLPYAHGPNVRKLSKITTLILARNYIMMLNSTVSEFKRIISTSNVYPTLSTHFSYLLNCESSVSPLDAHSSTLRPSSQALLSECNSTSFQAKGKKPTFSISQLIDTSQSSKESSL